MNGDVVRFPVYDPINAFLKPNDPDNHNPVGLSNIKETVMYSVRWAFYPDDREPYTLRGWHCYKCRSTFFVSDPETQLFHECMEARHTNSSVPM
jgi:hypothetical protein